MKVRAAASPVVQHLWFAHRGDPQPAEPVAHWPAAAVIQPGEQLREFAVRREFLGRFVEAEPLIRGVEFDPRRRSRTAPPSCWHAIVAGEDLQRGQVVA